MFYTTLSLRKGQKRQQQLKLIGGGAAVLGLDNADRTVLTVRGS